MDIERLLQWAYREELIKRITSSAEAVWDRIADVGFYGIVGEGSSPQRYDHGAPHPDAIKIERAVAALPDAVIDWELEAELILGDLINLVEPRAAIEVEPIRSTTVTWPAARAGRVKRQLQPPRQVILVRSLRTSALVVQHASMGTRPNWREEHPHPLPTPAARGPGSAVVGECIRKGLYAEGSYCPVRWWPSPINVAEARADYLAWWRGLEQLART